MALAAQATCLGVGSAGRCAPGAGLAHPASQRRQSWGCPGASATATPAACRSRRSAAPRASQTGVTEAQTAEAEQRLSLELPTADVQAAVRLMAVQQGRGTAIVVSAVDPGSQAAAAGVRVGQQLLEVSDPIRYADTWPLNERASLRYVRECIRMRRDAVVQLVLTRQPIPEWQQAVAAARAAAAAEAQQEQAPDASTGSQDDGDDLLSAIVSAAAAGTSTDEGDSEAAAAAAAAAAGRPLTMAEKLEQQYQQQQVEAAAEARLAQQQMTALQQRQARRRERLEVDDQRNDSKFFFFVALFFVLPPLIILGVAFGTGYLDSLDPYASMR